MLTLFLSISGGLSWGEALLPLLPVGFTSTASFILFIDALSKQRKGIEKRYNII